MTRVRTRRDSGRGRRAGLLVLGGVVVGYLLWRRAQPRPGEVVVFDASQPVPADSPSRAAVAPWHGEPIGPVEPTTTRVVEDHPPAPLEPAPGTPPKADAVPATPVQPSLVDPMTESLGQPVGAPVVPEPVEHPVIASLRQNVELAAGARSGGLWLAVSSWVTQGFQFLVSIVMARLLLPSQFGETALVYAISGFAYIFTDLGLSAAVIHAENVTDDLLDTAFWLNALSGLGLTLLLAAVAYPIAALYGHPQLTGLFIVTGLSFTLSLGSIHLALLERTFQFRTVGILESAASIAGFVTMPLCVWAGLGIYSIVLGPLVTTALASAFLWASVPWRPHLRISTDSMRQIWRFSKGLVGFNAVNYWSRNLDNVLLGAYVSETQLGDYNRSYNLMLVPVGQVNVVLMRGLYPALARMQDDPQRLGRAWVRAIATAGGAFMLPLTLTMSATAPYLVRVLYGPRWDGMIPMLELLCLAAVPQMIAASCGAPYRAVNRGSLLFKIGLIGTAITVLAIVVGIQWGAVGVAAALLVKSCVNITIAALPLARICQLSSKEVLGPILKSWVPSGAVLAAELVVRFWLGGHLPAAEVLLMQLVAGLGAFSLMMWRSSTDSAVEVRRTLEIGLKKVNTRLAAIG